MEKPTHNISHVSQEYPSGLKTAAEVSQLLQGIDEQRLLELAEAGYMPHFRIDSGPPMFKITEVKNWIANNLLNRVHGRGMPESIKLVIPAPDLQSKPPLSIANIPFLQEIPKWGYQPGVYFLCKGDAVAYVGQSVAPAARLATHSASSKDFDTVFLLPTPQSELDNVEAAFIQHLRPRLNGRVGSKSMVSPRLSKTKEAVFAEIGATISMDATAEICK